jgi:rhodanese-related sulfurtransferase
MKERSKTQGVPAAGGETVTAILARASERARDAALEYIGLATAEEALHLARATRVRVVDVRSHGERECDGELPGSVPIEWRAGDQPALDESFLAELARRVEREDIVIFVSGHGARSHRAAGAAATAGYVHALSVIDGIEAMRTANHP